jgi:hypothetical protein
MLSDFDSVDDKLALHWQQSIPMASIASAPVPVLNHQPCFSRLSVVFPLSVSVQRPPQRPITWVTCDSLKKLTVSSDDWKQ